MVEKVNKTDEPLQPKEDETATIDDVARMAGVSPATVSRVLNKRQIVTETTRQRVLEAIAQLNYQPNSLGRNLATRRTRTFGLVIADITNPFSAEVVRGVEGVLYDQGMSLLLYDTMENSEREAQALTLLGEGQIDGLIMCSPLLSQQKLISLIRPGLPLVFINYLPIPASVGTVEIDQEAGVRAAMQHLVDLGHRQIAYIGGITDSQVYQRRLAAYRTACEEAGIEVPDHAILLATPTIQGGWQAVHQLLQDTSSTPSRRPTALLAHNDLIAMGALIAAQEAGVVVPGQLSIIGYDNIPYSGLIHPALTTVQQPARMLGEQAVSLMITYLQKHTLPQGMPALVRLTPTLIVRASTATAPIDHTLYQMRN
ncbi:LacI family transcriptional regulator [Ktedonobacteria bacterium brp13]|nr:LacI family transcriptional regulator [Ktedonobacteria bacterium brp13]